MVVKKFTSESKAERLYDKMAKGKACVSLKRGLNKQGKVVYTITYPRKSR